MILFLLACAASEAGEPDAVEKGGGGWTEIDCSASEGDFVADLDEPAPIVVWLGNGTSWWLVPDGDSYASVQNGELRIQEGNASMDRCRVFVAD